MPPTYLGLLGGLPGSKAIKPSDCYDLQGKIRSEQLQPDGDDLGFRGLQIVLRWGIEETRLGNGFANRRSRPEKRGSLLKAHDGAVNPSHDRRLIPVQGRKKGSKITTQGAQGP